MDCDWPTAVDVVVGLSTPVEGVLEEERPDDAERPAPFALGSTENGDLLSQIASSD